MGLALRAFQRCSCIKFMELLRYAPHLNTENLKVNKFVFGLNLNIHVKVRILIPHTFCDPVQKALIGEEELNNGSHNKNPSIMTGHISSGEL
jgi:hypothetical protein